MSPRLRTLVDLFDDASSRFAERPLYGTKLDGAWQWTTYGELVTLVDRFRAALAQLGVGKGDRVAIIANNRLEWAVASYATYGLEAAFVAMYRYGALIEGVYEHARTAATSAAGGGG